ncbi:MAG TPA: ribbon-helix-helix protein, CopG family [Polyangiales bacterium]|nr:ribbon-helix-helix protein, CopG family [Polyangiales bacterium]
MSSRINARVDDELAEKVEELRRITGKSASAIIKAALEAYFETVKGSSETRPRRALEQAGFIACANGEPNLSRDYKRELADSLRGKT